MMTKKYLALRVRNYDKLVAFLRDQGVSVIHSRLETRDQALRNLTEGLFDQGVERVIDHHELRWMMVEGEFDDHTIESWSLCDVSMGVEWFEKYKRDIRHYSGVAYWDATYGLAKDLSVKPQNRELIYDVEVTDITESRLQTEVEAETGIETEVNQGSGIKTKSGNATTNEQDVHEQRPLITAIAKKQGRRPKKVAEEFQLDLFG